MGPLDILHHDKDVIAIEKPSGLLSVPGKGSALADSALTRVEAQVGRAYSVHRLDMDTSGILLFALRRKAERDLKQQFRERLISKRYEAIVSGHLEPKQGVIEFPLVHDLMNKPKSKVCHSTGEAARTEYRVIEQTKQGSRVSLVPITGRSHQLRVHLLALGHPILGDRFYATGDALRASKQLLLHAAKLCFTHPYSGVQTTVFSDPKF